MFKRRDKRSWWQVAAQALWPRGGWTRAAQYVRHRLRRLPDTPDRIARGLFAGVFTPFTPFYGLHFIIAALVAKAARGNIFAALMGTFFGNPLTYVPIGVISLQTGHFILGTNPANGAEHVPKDTLLQTFGNAFGDLWNNILALFTPETAHWDGLTAFFYEIFVPYLVGGILPGFIAGTVAYYISLPLITAYKNRRKGIIKAKLTEIRKKASKKSNHIE